MDPILENEPSTSGSPTSHGKAKNKNKKKKNQNDSETDSQTVIGERRRFVVTKLSTSDEHDSPECVAQSNAHTVHFGTRGAESQRPHVKSIFKDRTGESARSSSAERETDKKEYETFHGTSSSPRSSIFDYFKLRRKSEAKKHNSLLQNVKTAFGGSSKTPEIHTPNEENADEPKKSHKKYYHTVTGASSRKYSPITKVMEIFRSKPQTEIQPSTSDGKKKVSKPTRRQSIGTTSPTYHKNSYASLDPIQAKQLFREVRGLPRYDPYLSIVQISLGGRDKTRLLLNFFKYHKCYEILPKSAKVIIFDTQFLVRKTFPTLISHGIRSAPLWDQAKKQLVGMITVTDFIRILLHFEAENIPMADLERHTLHAWKRILRNSRKPLYSVSPDQSLHEAINMLNKNRVHRLLMIDPITGDVLYILSHKRILRFLFVYLNEFPELVFFHKSIVDLKIGTYDNIYNVTDVTTIKEAFQLLLEKNVSALPILDESGKLIDVYAKYEVLNLVSEKLYSNLYLTIGDVRNKKKDWEEKLQKCHSSITLYEALEVIVRTESHRLLLVNNEDKLIGIVSLSDILLYLNRIIPAEKRVSSLQELFRPLEENKFTESARENDTDEITIHVPSKGDYNTTNDSHNVIPKLEIEEKGLVISKETDNQEQDGKDREKSEEKIKEDNSDACQDENSKSSETGKTDVIHKTEENNTTDEKIKTNENGKLDATCESVNYEKTNDFEIVDQHNSES